MCTLYNVFFIIKLEIVVIYSCHSLKNYSNYSNMKTHIDTLLILAVCGFPLASVYDSDSSNRAILIQNEDLNALQTTGSMNDTLSDIMSVYMVI